MSEAGGKTSRPWEPQHYRQELHSPEGKRPEGDLVFFLLDRVPQWDVSHFYAPYEQETRGAPPCDPAMLVCLVLSAYCVGVFSSRTRALACERTLALLAIVGSERPDFRTISDCRTLHLAAFKDVLVQVVRLAGEAGLVKLGNVSTDGTKIQGHAARHQAMRSGSMQQAGERRREDIATLVTQAQHQDESDDAALGSRRGDALPAARTRREDRLARIESAMRRLAAQARAEAHAERKRRAAAEAERRRVGKPRRGQEPQPVDERPAEKAQSTCTDPERHSMPTNNQGWEDCGNAQVRVDATCQIVVACDVTDASHDTQQAEPMGQATLATLGQAGIALPRDATGAPQALPATLDSGYDSEAAVVALATLGCDPSMATGRQRHHDPEAPVPQEPATAHTRMAAQGQTPTGKALYARRKVSVEPVFGQSKEARGFRRFLLRGLDNIRGAWRLVCLTHTLLKIWRYGCVVHAG
jgi:transposase